MILNLSTQELVTCFDRVVADTGNEQIIARSFIDFCSYKALDVLTLRPDYLSDQDFRRWTFDMMLAWDAPSVDIEPINKEGDTSRLKVMRDCLRFIQLLRNGSSGCFLGFELFSFVSDFYSFKRIMRRNSFILKV